MTLTPDEIKNLLENHKSYTFNLDSLMADALALIRQLQEQNDTIMQSFQRLKKVCVAQGTTIRQLEAERDAAVKDLTEIVQASGEPYCEYCEWNGRRYCAGRCWTHNEGFKWRGVQKEG